MRDQIKQMEANVIHEQKYDVLQRMNTNWIKTRDYGGVQV